MPTVTSRHDRYYGFTREPRVNAHTPCAMCKLETETRRLGLTAAHCTRTSRHTAAALAAHPSPPHRTTARAHAPAHSNKVRDCRAHLPLHHRRPLDIAQAPLRRELEAASEEEGPRDEASQQSGGGQGRTGPEQGRQREEGLVAAFGPSGARGTERGNSPLRSREAGPPIVVGEHEAAARLLSILAAVPQALPPALPEV